VAIYSFERLTALVVEDNDYMREVMTDLLRQLGFREVKTAKSGAEAIDLLKIVGQSTSMQYGMGIDLVISDLIMSPVNGILLLRWVRMAKESPDRFLPFIMLSGAADNAYVNSARDIGTCEFLAKPFSARSVYQRLLSLIDHPRQFVMTHDYFGPDRRRRKDGVETDRRENTEKDVTIVYSSNKVTKQKDKSAVYLFRLPNRLKDKVAGIGSSGTGELPIALLDEAEEQLDRTSLDFADWALTYLADLSDLCTESLLHPGNRPKHFEEINLLAHELRGQGGTFGYPLITTFAKSLYDCTGKGCNQSDPAVEVVKAHIDSMRAVLKERIKGDGGEVGKQIFMGLRKAIAKHREQFLV
jgi:CheY-like chemotaxis protein